MSTLILGFNPKDLLFTEDNGLCLRAIIGVDMDRDVILVMTLAVIKKNKQEKKESRNKQMKSRSVFMIRLSWSPKALIKTSDHVHLPQ